MRCQSDVLPGFQNCFERGRKSSFAWLIGRTPRDSVYSHLRRSGGDELDRRAARLDRSAASPDLNQYLSSTWQDIDWIRTFAGPSSFARRPVKTIESSDPEL